MDCTGDWVDVCWVWVLYDLPGLFELSGGYVYEVCGECDCSEYVYEELFCGCVSVGGKTVVWECGCTVGDEYLWLLRVGVDTGSFHILEVW